MVTGTSTRSVKATGPPNTARITGPHLVKFATSPAACSGEMRSGLVTITPYISRRPAVRRDSAGTAGVIALPPSRAAVNTACA